MTAAGETLHKLLRDFAAFGGTPDGGVCRLAGTAADGAARDRLVHEATRRGLALQVDPIGNMFAVATLAPVTEAVIVGSHLDSQPTGGCYDGTYGVLAGLLAVEAVQARAAGAPGTARRNLVLANWTNEEGARFQPSLTGSSVFAGTLALEDALELSDAGGLTLRAALDSIGYRGTSAPSWVAERYVEVHVEQGDVLETSHTAIGVVEAAWAARKLCVVFQGEPSHTGPTPMPRRRDALRAAARGIEAMYDGLEDGAHAAAARIIVEPNSPNVVAARVQVWFELRHEAKPVSDRLAERLLARLGEVSAPLGVGVTVAVDESRAPAKLDARGVALVRRVADDLGVSARTLKTVAGHDAIALQRRLPATLIFVPSRNGLSHNAAEYTDPAALETGLAVLTETLWRMVTAAQ